ncbi:MAG: acyl-CoA dehydrogenase family protein [Comamonas sp.]
MFEMHGQCADLSVYAKTRDHVRAFLSEELRQKHFKPWQTTWTTFDREFSRRAGAAGFIGMTWPKAFGGQESSALERYVVIEEMLAAGAPCGAHWIADRQSGPQILQHGSERAKREILPRIADGTYAFGIGMSEPDSGSDLAAVRTRAEKVDGGWLINGTKVWTTNAHQVDFLITLVRTSPPNERKHQGLTQMITRMDQPGVTVRPILDISGHHEFNEVHFENYFVPDDMLIGEPGSGWSMVTSELAYERSGPDRYLSSWQLFTALIDEIGNNPNQYQSVQLGRLVAHALSLRQMSTGIAVLLETGNNPQVEASLVKHLGTSFERDIPEVARNMFDTITAHAERSNQFKEALAKILLTAPSFTLRGGTREILRGVIARGMGLR